MQIDYAKLTDEELIILDRNNDDEAIEYLIKKYKPLVRSLASSKFIIGAEKEDVIQEGMLGLFKAIRDYDQDKGAKFSTFANLCISRQISTAVDSSNTAKNIPLNTYVSLYSADTNADGEESRELIDEYQGEVNMSPEQVFIDRETTEALEAEIIKNLSEFEREVYSRYRAGKSYIEIANELGREAKTCDNALQRIKAKIKKILEK